jgi:hypothetical protein
MEDAYEFLKLGYWVDFNVSFLQGKIKDGRLDRARDKARALAKSKAKAKAKAQPVAQGKAKAQAKSKAQAKAKAKAKVKASAQPEAKAKSKARAKAKTVPGARGQLLPRMPGHQLVRAIFGGQPVHVPPAQAVVLGPHVSPAMAWLPVPDSPVMGSTSPSSSD